MLSIIGDGYEFRALFGLPLTQDPKVYDLTFNVSETDADVIEGFLRSRVNDQASFTFTPPAEGGTKTGTYSQSTTTSTITMRRETRIRGKSCRRKDLDGGTFHDNTAGYKSRGTLKLKAFQPNVYKRV